MALNTIGSGLDIPTIVSQLVSAERAPTANRINTQGTSATAKLSTLGNIKSSLSGVQSALEAAVKSAATHTYKTTVPDGSGFSTSIITEASTGKTLATAGIYNIEVISLATSQKLSSGAFAADAPVGSGKLTFAWGEQTLDVDIVEGSTLGEVAAAINRAAGGKGVNATIITASDGQHLVMNAVNAGEEGSLTVTASGGNGGLSALTWDGVAVAGRMSQPTAATNALVRVDGFERESSNNTISDIIPGVTLNLSKAEKDTVRTLTVAQDNSPLKINLQAFVGAYNSTINLLKNSSAYDAANGKASTLTGDSMVRGLQQQLRSQLSANVVDLKDLGLAINKDGTLAFSTTTFDKSMAENPSAAESLLGKNGKLSSSMAAMLRSNLDTTGTLNLRTDSLSKQIKKLEQDLDALDLRMKKVSERYTKQFTAMDTLVAQMQSTSSYLSQQLSTLASQNS